MSEKIEALRAAEHALRVAKDRLLVRGELLIHSTCNLAWKGVLAALAEECPKCGETKDDDRECPPPILRQMREAADRMAPLYRPGGPLRVDAPEEPTRSGEEGATGGEGIETILVAIAKEWRRLARDYDARQIEAFVRLYRAEREEHARVVEERDELKRRADKAKSLHAQWPSYRILDLLEGRE